MTDLSEPTFSAYRNVLEEDSHRQPIMSSIFLYRVLFWLSTGIAQALRLLVWMLSVAVLSLSGVTASAQSYPSKLVHILTAAPGSANDVISRIIAKDITSTTGQPAIVENYGGVLSVERLAKAEPDGHTILITGSAAWLLPFLRDKVAWDPIKDLAPVTMAFRSVIVLVVHPSMPVRSVGDLISLAKRGKELNYSAGAPGGPPHLAAELFKQMTGSRNIVGIYYKGSGPAVMALIGGEVQVMFPNLGSALPHLKSGRLRAIAVGTKTPSTLAPNLPTIAATVPGYEALSAIGVFVPTKTPAPIIRLIQQEIARALNKPDVKQLMLNDGSEPVGNSPEEFGAFLKSEMDRLGKLIKDLGLRE